MLPVTNRRHPHLSTEVGCKPTSAGIANPFHNHFETVVGFTQELAGSFEAQEAQLLEWRRLELLAE